MTFGAASVVPSRWSVPLARARRGCGRRPPIERRFNEVMAHQYYSHIGGVSPPRGAGEYEGYGS